MVQVPATPPPVSNNNNETPIIDAQSRASKWFKQPSQPNTPVESPKKSPKKRLEPQPVPITAPLPNTPVVTMPPSVVKRGEFIPQAMPPHAVYAPPPTVLSHLAPAFVPMKMVPMPYLPPGVFEPPTPAIREVIYYNSNRFNT